MKFKKLFLSIVVMLLFIIVSSVHAESPKITSQDYTDLYKKWNDIPDNEKKNYIQPLPFAVDISSDTSASKKDIKSKTGILPSKYNLKDEIELVVRDQQETGECWAFTTTNLISTNIEKLGFTNSYTYFSTRHMNYTTTKTFLDGINPKGFNRELDVGANAFIGLNYCTAGYGPVLNSEMPFENNANKINLSNIAGKKVTNKINEYIELPSIYKKIENGELIYYNGYSSSSTNYLEYTEEEVQTARNKIKNQIRNNGAVSAYTYLNGTKYFDSKTLKSSDSYYCYTDEVPNHSITIVGWDDEYSKDNFNSKHKPEHDGAYIVLNSHGEDYYDEGYMYVSYDDFLIETSMLGIVESTEKIDYDNIYQYDELGHSNNITLNSIEPVYTANVFERKNLNSGKAEYLNEISFYVPEKQTISIYANLVNDDKTKIELIESLGELDVGYHTFKLSTPLEITGEKFIVSVKYQNGINKAILPVEYNFYSNDAGSNFWNTVTSEYGQSYYSINGTLWFDINKYFKDTNFCIKAFTTEQVIDTTGVELNDSKVTLTSGNTKKLVATIKPFNATNKNVKWTSEDDTIATVDSNGLVTAKKAGMTKIIVTTEDGNYTDECTVVVLPKLTYQVHGQTYGWQTEKTSGEIAGTTGKYKRVEAIKVNIEGYENGVTYSSYVENEGWQEEKTNGEISGTTGKSKRIEAIKIKLSEELAEKYDIYYRVHVQHYGWLGWASNGEIAGTVGYEYRIEAIQIELVEKASEAPGKTTNAYLEKEIQVKYQAHGQTYGWQKEKANGELAGTTGKSKRIEGIKIRLTNFNVSGSIEYQVHGQTYGWQAWKKNGELAGTTGKSKRMEAIKIKLTGELAEKYDIYYRVHIQKLGWQAWKKNGKIAGTTGKALRMEAIQIKLVEK